MGFISQKGTGLGMLLYALYNKPLNKVLFTPVYNQRQEQT